MKIDLYLFTIILWLFTGLLVLTQPYEITKLQYGLLLICNIVADLDLYFNKRR